MNEISLAAAAASLALLAWTSAPGHALESIGSPATTVPNRVPIQLAATIHQAPRRTTAHHGAQRTIVNPGTQGAAVHPRLQGATIHHGPQGTTAHRGPQGPYVHGRPGHQHLYRSANRPASRAPAHPAYRPPAPANPPAGAIWTRPAWYHWAPGGAVAAGVAIGSLEAAAVTAWAPPPPKPGLCWYYTDQSQKNGFWDVCP